MAKSTVKDAIKDIADFASAEVAKLSGETTDASNSAAKPTTTDASNSAAKPTTTDASNSAAKPATATPLTRESTPLSARTQAEIAAGKAALERASKLRG